MEVADILTVGRIRRGVSVTSKKKALEAVAALLGSADDTVAAQSIADGLFARERLGSTALGSGVAIPHTRSGAVDTATGAFLALAPPIDFDAADGQPVDLVFGLIVPEDSTNEHLQILAKLAELFSNPSIRAQLRDDLSEAEVLEVLSRRDTAKEPEP
jgi:PTS system nitrogen regulatory IIA component